MTSEHIGPDPVAADDWLVIPIEGRAQEDAATQLLTYPNDFTNVAWLKSVSLIDAEEAIGPDGTLSASVLKDNDGGCLLYTSPSPRD